MKNSEASDYGRLISDGALDASLADLLMEDADAHPNVLRAIVLPDGAVVMANAAMQGRFGLQRGDVVTHRAADDQTRAELTRALDGSVGAMNENGITLSLTEVSGEVMTFNAYIERIEIGADKVQAYQLDVFPAASARHADIAGRIEPSRPRARRKAGFSMLVEFPIALVLLIGGGTGWVLRGAEADKREAAEMAVAAQQEVHRAELEKKVAELEAFKDAEQLKAERMLPRLERLRADIQLADNHEDLVRLYFRLRQVEAMEAGEEITADQATDLLRAIGEQAITLTRNEVLDNDDQPEG